MINFQMSILIKRPAEDVFAFVTDIENEPKWHSNIVATKRLTEGPVGPGTKWREVFHWLDTQLSSVLEITEYQPNRKAVFEGTPLGPIIPRFMISVAALGPQATSLQYIVEPRIVEACECFVSTAGILYAKHDLRTYLVALKRTLERKPKAPAQVMTSLLARQYQASEAAYTSKLPRLKNSSLLEKFVESRPHKPPQERNEKVS